MKKWIAVILLIIFFVPACAKSEREARMRIAFLPNLTHAQALVMKERNTLQPEAGEDILVEWKAFNAGPSVIEAMFAGELDIALIGPVPAINAHMKSQGDVRVIAGAANGGVELVAAKESGIAEVGDLKSKTVAVPQLGNTQHLCLLALLYENGLAPTSEGGSVHVVAVSNPDVQGLMERKEVDAAMLPEPWASILEINCGATPIFFDGKEAATTVVIVRQEFWEKHPEAVALFITSHRKMTQDIIDNPAAAKNDLNRQLKQLTGKEICSDILDLAFARIEFSDIIPEKSFKQYAMLCEQNGLIQAMPESDVLFIQVEAK